MSDNIYVTNKNMKLDATIKMIEREQRMLEIENVDTSTLTLQEQFDIVEEYQELWKENLKEI